MKFENYLQHYLNNNLKKVSGFLNPIKWDSNGKAISFSIYTSNDEDIIITGNFSLEKMRLLLSKLVEAKGYIEVNKDGEKSLNLKSIREIQSPHTPIMISKPSYFSEEFCLNLPRNYSHLNTGVAFNSYQLAS